MAQIVKNDKHGDADRRQSLGRSGGHYTDMSISDPQTSGQPNMTPTDRSEQRAKAQDKRTLSHGDYSGSRGARY